MLIKIIKGNYGYNNGRIVKAKTPSDKPFEVDDAEAARLIEQRIAKAVDNFPVDGTLSAEEETSDNAPYFPKADGDAVGEDDEDYDVPDYNDEMSNADLQSIAKEYGIPIPNRANKSEIITALDHFFGNAPTLRS